MDELTTESNPVSPSSPSSLENPYRFVTLNEFCALPADPQKWIVKKLIPVGGMVNLYAKPKVGKSYLMLSIIESIIQSMPSWDGFGILKHGPVMYLQIDTPREEWMDRAKQMQQRLIENGCGVSNGVYFPAKPVIIYSIVNSVSSLRLQSRLKRYKQWLKAKTGRSTN